MKYPFINIIIINNKIKFISRLLPTENNEFRDGILYLNFFLFRLYFKKITFFIDLQSQFNSDLIFAIITREKNIHIFYQKERKKKRNTLINLSQ